MASFSSSSPPSLVLVSTGQSRWFDRFLSANPLRPQRVAQLAGAPLTPACLADLLHSECAALDRSLNGLDEAALRLVLRRVRALTLATLIERDLAGHAGLGEVMRAMTALAELSINAALSVLIPELVGRHGVPIGAASAVRQDLIVVGMGKLGGGELNVSSDIDLIFLYGEEGDTVPAAGTTAKGLSNHEFFTHLGRRLIGVLSEATADGFVFRVDMDLRPNGNSGPLVTSLDALEEYFMRQGRDWERFAWIKARVVSDAVLGDASREQIAAELDQVRRPFVYRRYLDFGTIAALRTLHGLIRAEVARNGAARGTGQLVNVKLGRGGIREIEFVVQHFQLIRGGRDPELRGYATLAMLDVLARKNFLDVAVAGRLAKAYVLLRNVEHRLQYLDDAQTHTLPASAEDRERIACMSGFADAAQLDRVLAEEQAFVARVFDEVFGAVQSSNAGSTAGPGQDQGGHAALTSPEGLTCPDCWGPQLEAVKPVAATLQGLQAFGFVDAAGAWSRLRALWMTSRVRTLVPQSRARLDALIPQTMRAAVHAAGEPSRTLGRMLDLFEAIAGRAAYLALLSEFPQALERVTRLMAASQWTAQYLIRHPILLDELLDSRTLFAPPDWAAVEATLRTDLAHADGDVERQMDILRETHHAHTFRLLAQDLEGRMTVETLADHLSALADLILQVTLETVWQQWPGRHRDTPKFGVIAYGKLGGKELGYASDLDIIFLFDDDDERAPEIYARYAQRINTWLSSRTTAGALFEIDLQLRPDGASGMMVTSLEAFRKYQRESAWLWEHQALTRARFVAGDAALGAAFEAERRAILARSRDLASLRSEIAAMRKKLHDAHPNASGLFDLKHDAGGMIDIEFSVQYLVLAYSATYPMLLDDVGNIALLRRAGEAGLIDAGLAISVGDAYRLYRKRQHALRLNDARFARAEAEDFADQREQVKALWNDLFSA